MRENISKIQYISVANKIYKVNNIDFHNLKIEAKETNLFIDDVPESEVWDISEFKHYKVKLINNGGKADIIDFEDWKGKHDLKK